MISSGIILSKSIQSIRDNHSPGEPHINQYEGTRVLNTANISLFGWWFQLFSGWWFGTFFIFHIIWDNPSYWLSYFSRWLKPPTGFWFSTIDMGCSIHFFALFLGWKPPASWCVPVECSTPIVFVTVTFVNHKFQNSKNEVKRRFKKIHSWRDFEGNLFWMFFTIPGTECQVERQMQLYCSLDHQWDGSGRLDRPQFGTRSTADCGNVFWWVPE